jgi:rhodanese-related sulfurtransferase
MAGVIILGYFGALDLDLIYINPTYLWSAIVGGLIMGVGFIVGGFCPGTSICAMAIGKIDAIIFVLGGIFGVFAFAEGYSYFEPLYLGSFWGNVRIFDTFGISQGIVACGMIVVAVGAFYATDYVERRVNGSNEKRDGVLLRKYYTASGAAILIAIALIFMPEKKTRMLNEVDANGYIESQSVPTISADELTFRLLDHDRTLLLIDVRRPELFKQMTLPGALNIQADQLFSKDTREVLSESRRHYIFFGNNEEEGKRAAVLARNIGYDNVLILKGGMEEFSSTILAPVRLRVATTKLEKDELRFRTNAGPAIARMIKESRNVQKIVKQTKKISGGC